MGGVGGSDSNYLEGSSQVQREFLFEDFVISAFSQTLADSGGGVVDPDPSASCRFCAAEESIVEGRVPPVYSSNGESVLFSHEFVHALLTLASKVVIDELVVVKALLGTTV